ncbi:hypothetical protein [Streptomyces sp. NPDC048436]|uniref:hypothetical protein n=1 Tax=Streptomyces sp. NPDC048436 TaxID=3365550 RepID=UPI00370FAE43
MTFTLTFDADVDFYLCANPDVAATETSCPKRDTVYLASQTFKGLKKDVTRYFTKLEIAQDIVKVIARLAWDILVQDFVDCYHGSVSGCGWVAANFIPGKKIEDAVQAIRSLDTALKAGSKTSGAWKAVKASGLSSDVISGIGKRAKEALKACRVRGAAVLRSAADECLVPPMLDDFGEDYVRGKHVEGGANVTWKKGVFDSSVDLDELVEMSYRSKPVGPNHEGHYERYVDAGTLIGRTSEMSGKKPTSWLLVSQDKYGSVRTMYPIEKPAV